MAANGLTTPGRLHQPDRALIEGRQQPLQPPFLADAPEQCCVALAASATQCDRCRATATTAELGQGGESKACA